MITDEKMAILEKTGSSDMQDLCAEVRRLRACSLREQVREFHRVFEHPTADTPTIPSDERVRFRLALCAEEFFELLEAALAPRLPVDDAGRVGVDYLTVVKARLHECIERNAVKIDLPEFVDAMADLDYVVEGTRLEFGIDGGPVAAEVHRSNMAKMWDDGVHKTPAGKTVKPPTWTPPDLAGALHAQGWEP